MLVLVLVLVLTLLLVLILILVLTLQVEDQPVYEHNIFMHLYFVCFFIIGSFFTFTFLIRAIMDYLQRDKICNHTY